MATTGTPLLPPLPHLHVDEPWGSRMLQEEIHQGYVPLLHGQVQSCLIALEVLEGKRWG